MAKRRRKRIASRGSVNNTILKTLINGDKYGYEIIKEVEEFSDGKIKLKQPSLYSSLSRFEEKGFVTSYWGDSDIGGRRHYYHLTESGIQYYEKEVLKLGRDEDVENEEEEEVIAENIESEDEDEEIVLTEVDETEIPSIATFPDKEEEVVIPDHQFYKQTPIEKHIPQSDRFEEQYVLKKAATFDSAPITISATPTPTNIQPTPADSIMKEVSPWKIQAAQAKESNTKVYNTALRKLHYVKVEGIEEKPEDNVEEIIEEKVPEVIEETTITPEPVIEPEVIEETPQPITSNSKIIIKDKDGIFKLRDSNYDPNKPVEKSKPVIIDNVIKRRNPNNVFGYTAYSEQTNKTPTPKSTIEISDEERKQRNENFVEKFNSISRTKQQDKAEEDLSKTYIHKLDMLRVSGERDDTPPPPPRNFEPIITRSILDEEDEEEEEEYLTPQEPEIEQNNMFEYVDEEDNIVDLEEETVEDNIVDLEPEQFETRNDNKQYIEEISNYSAPKETLKMNRYENKTTAILSDKTYVLINKVKFVFGLLLAIIMVAELLGTFVLLRDRGLIIDNDNTLFVVSYAITGFLALIYILPVIFNANEHRLNNFKMKYAIIFGILTFLVSMILIYCVNTLLGFKLDNFEFFATKIIVPAVMVFNFVILPPIYGLLLKSKKFYD
ncbi:MAG: hypothetical protein E7354_01615 [Clostridiales bacterium]|nr:hypothetical protein [Clostridiales bacterium]